MTNFSVTGTVTPKDTEAILRAYPALTRTAEQKRKQVVMIPMQGIVHVADLPGFEAKQLRRRFRRHRRRRRRRRRDRDDGHGMLSDLSDAGGSDTDMRENDGETSSSSSDDGYTSAGDESGGAHQGSRRKERKRRKKRRGHTTPPDFRLLLFTNSTASILFQISLLHLDHFVRGDIPVILKNTPPKDSRQKDVFLWFNVQRSLVDPRQAPMYDLIELKLSSLSANIELLVIEQLIQLAEKEMQMLEIFQTTRQQVRSIHMYTWMCVWVDRENIYTCTCVDIGRHDGEDREKTQKVKYSHREEERRGDRRVLLRCRWDPFQRRCGVCLL